MKRILTMFILPVLLWMYIFKSFLNGSITFYLDTYSLYSSFKYFYNNLFNGVVPLWDPFVQLGIPNINIPASGLLSPLMAFFASLHFLGVNYYACFMLFILFFFFLGLTGFYLLALEILEDRFYAWLAFIALLFSGMGPMLFNQLYIYFLFFPTVWLFYFLFRFSKTFEIKYFWGIIVTSMNMCCFYIPFYFLTLFLFFTVLMGFLYPLYLVEFASGLKGFIVQNKKIFFGGVLLVIFALAPLALLKVSLNGEDILSPARRNVANTAVISINAPNEKNASVMTFDEASLKGTLGERMKGGRLFSHLDKYIYSSDDFFYIPVMVYLIIFIASFVPFGRRQIFILCLGLSIFLLSLGQVAPLHKILFNTVFYFKYFRNFFFFIAFLIPITVLFAMFQLKELLDSSGIEKKRWQNVAVNTLLHFIFLCILRWHGNILISTYITVFVSCILFNLSFFKPKLFKITLFLIMILEPIRVFAYFESNSLDYKFSAPAMHSVPIFRYERPALKQNHFDVREYWDDLHDLSMQDSEGRITDSSQIVGKFTYILSKIIDKDVFQDYIHYKFYIYDRVQYMKDLSILKLKEVLRKHQNLAFVSDPIESNILQENRWFSAAPLIVSHDTEAFKVIDFNTDRIKLMTDFNTRKFLVYTDSFEKYWRVFINGHEEKLYRANVAFKGIWLPAGKDEVVFQYSVPWEKESYLSLLLFNALLFIYLIRRICIK